MTRVGIIGAGLIGEKRAAHLAGATLTAVADIDTKRAERLAEKHGAQIEADWQTLVQRPDVDVVLVCTTNNALSPCTMAALQAGKHVLVEKPAGCSPTDILTLIQTSDRAGRLLRVGYNHRFHPAFQKAKQLIQNGQIGPLMYIRARYGHGGRLGYDREWRADPKLSGGGELLDQGVHLIDLCRWLGGEFDLEWGKTKTFFWKMPVEDNGFLALKSPDGRRSAWLHASCTEWKNLFDFEIFGETGKLQIWGLGRSYGVEELRIFRMKPEMGPPDIEVISFPGEDTSWENEFRAFLSELGGHPTDLATPADALKAMEIVHACYEQSSPCNA